MHDSTAENSNKGVIKNKNAAHAPRGEEAGSMFSTKNAYDEMESVKE